MKVEVKSKKGLRTTLSVIVDKKYTDKNGRETQRTSKRGGTKRF